jgi:hypothetical protein
VDVLHRNCSSQPPKACQPRFCISFAQVEDFGYQMSWNLFQYVSYELSHSLQHLFLACDEEKNDFKGKWVISFELKNRVSCQLSQLDLASVEEEYVSLGRLSPHHQQSTGEKSEIHHFLRKYSLCLANSFHFLFLVDLIHVFRIRILFCKSYKY